MKVVCINNGKVGVLVEKSKILTVDKIYDVIEISTHGGFDYYGVIGDNGSYTELSIDRFKLISEIRNEKLINLGI